LTIKSWKEAKRKRWSKNERTKKIIQLRMRRISRERTIWNWKLIFWHGPDKNLLYPLPLIISKVRGQRLQDAYFKNLSFLQFFWCSLKKLIYFYALTLRIMSKQMKIVFKIQWKPLNGITYGQSQSDSNNWLVIIRE
jgi:hypothetical protein